MVVAVKAEKAKKSPHRKNKLEARKAPKQVLSALQHFDAAQAALQNDDFKTAIRHFQQASDAEPENVEYLDALGAVHAEVGQQEEAVKVLQRAVQVEPDRGFTKYMYLGQLLEGEEALHAMQRGVNVLQSAIDDEGVEEGDAELLQEQLCSALCCLAEAQMGSAGEVQEVADDCEALLLRAAQAAQSSPEPMQVLASLRVEQGRPEEALHCLRSSIATWCPSLVLDPEDGEMEGAEEDRQQPDEAKDSQVRDKPAPHLPSADKDTAAEDGQPEKLEQDIDEESDWEDEEDDDNLPSFEFRVETAKLLIELDEDNHAATQVLEMLIAEDDTVPEVWYLLGLALHGGGEFDDALNAAGEAERLVSQRRHEDPDAGETLLDIEDLKAAIQESVANIKAASGKDAEP